MLRILFSFITMSGIPRLLYRLIFDKRVSSKLKLIPILAILYVLLPTDFLLDALPLIGRIDDIFLLVLGIILFLVMVPKEIVRDHLGTRGKSTLDNEESDARDEKIIDGEYTIRDDKPEERDSRNLHMGVMFKASRVLKSV